MGRFFYINILNQFKLINMKKWFIGKRVFPRWRLIILILIGVWVGSMIESSPLFAISYGLLMAWDLTKKP
jgi:Na+/proline symporter